mgnify:CR=1 FL=1
MPLAGVVEVDETFVGGVSKDRGQGPWANKTMVMGAISREGGMRLRVEGRRDRPTLQGFVRDNAAKARLVARAVLPDGSLSPTPDTGPAGAAVVALRYSTGREHTA